MEFSVAIPTYNRAHFIGETLASVRAQKLPAKEIIVVDDGSTDDTERLVRSAFPDVIYVRQKNAGAGLARYEAARRCTGDWIAFCDSDDIWRPDHLESIAALHLRWPEAGLLFTNFVNFTSNINHTFFDCFRSAPEGWWKKATDTRSSDMILFRQSTILDFIVFNPAWPSVSAVRRSIFECCGKTSPVISHLPTEDGDLTRRFLIQTRAACVDRNTVRLRKHPGNLSREKLVLSLSKASTLMQSLLDRPEIFSPYRNAIFAEARAQYALALQGAVRGRNVALTGHLFSFLERTGLSTILDPRYRSVGTTCAVFNRLTRSRLSKLAAYMIYDMNLASDGINKDTVGSAYQLPECTH